VINGSSFAEAFCFLRVVIDDFDVMCFPFPPGETHPVLVINSETMLALSIAHIAKENLFSPEKTIGQDGYSAGDCWQNGDRTNQRQ
jgi:hypothetical protein